MLPTDRVSFVVFQRLRFDAHDTPLVGPPSGVRVVSAFAMLAAVTLNRVRATPIAAEVSLKIVLKFIAHYPFVLRA